MSRPLNELESHEFVLFNKVNKTMKKLILLSAGFLLFCSHDMFLKLRSYHLSPLRNASIELFNGTFDRSDNTIDRNRMLDVSLVGNGERTLMDTIQWSEDGETTVLKFVTGEAGTWVAGVSTAPRNIELDAEAFNGYLEHDGVLDELEWRKANNAMGKAAVEKYSKHVKCIFQVGDKKTTDWDTELGYPIEFVPLSNPYEAEVGDQLQFKLLRNGSPLTGQLVYADFREPGHVHDHDHDHTGEGEDDHHHHHAASFTTNDDGVVTIKITDEGIWYLRTIHMEHRSEEGLTHESNWATVTFQIGVTAHAHHDHSHGHDHSHDHDHHGHDHDHHHHHGPPMWVYILGVVVLGIVGYWLYTRNQANH